jgi:hypothetical protein
MCYNGGMLESSNKYRAVFTAGEQRAWIEELKNLASLSEISKVCSCSERTVRDWQREKYHIDYSCVMDLCKKFKLKIPAIRRVSRSEFAREAGRKGGLSTVAKHGAVGGNEQVRKNGWEKWWNEKGRHKTDAITAPQPIVLPNRSAFLAEFCGIMLGDGGISDNQISITLHAKDDLTYATHVVALIRALFGLQPSVYTRESENVIVIVVSRVLLVRYLTNEIGLLKGSKVRQQASVPKWIVDDDRYAIACVRGLIDTDGTVYDHTYVSSGKKYSYKKLSFTNASKPLLEYMFRILTAKGLKPRLAGKHDVRLESKSDVARYFEIVGSHNPKHLKRMEY